MECPIFIVGMPRSGTTLLGMILNSHSQLAISPETHYFNKYWLQCQRSRCLRNKKEASKFLKDLLNSVEIKDMGFSAYEINRIYSSLINNKYINHQKILTEILSLYSKKHAKDVWGEKTPAHLQYVPIIKNLFPNAKFICIYRDPRDVVKSLREVPWNHGNIIINSFRWKHYAILANRYKKRYNSNFLEIKYEDLVQNPQHVMAEVCSFLNILFEYEMLNFYQKPRNFDLSREPWKTKNTQPLDTKNIYKWKADVPIEQARIVEIITKKWLKDKGYAFCFKKVNIKFFIKIIMKCVLEFGQIAKKKIVRKFKHG